MVAAAAAHGRRKRTAPSMRRLTFSGFLQAHDAQSVGFSFHPGSSRYDPHRDELFASTAAPGMRRAGLISTSKSSGERRILKPETVFRARAFRLLARRWVWNRSIIRRLRRLQKIVGAACRSPCSPRRAIRAFPTPRRRRAAPLKQVFDRSPRARRSLVRSRAVSERSPPRAANGGWLVVCRTAASVRCSKSQYERWNWQQYVVAISHAAAERSAATDEKCDKVHGFEPAARKLLPTSLHAASAGCISYFAKNVIAAVERGQETCGSGEILFAGVNPLFRAATGTFPLADRSGGCNGQNRADRSNT